MGGVGRREEAHHRDAQQATADERGGQHDEQRASQPEAPLEMAPEGGQRPGRGAHRAERRTAVQPESLERAPCARPGGRARGSRPRARARAAYCLQRSTRARGRRGSRPHARGRRGECARPAPPGRRPVRTRRARSPRRTPEQAEQGRQAAAQRARGAAESRAPAGLGAGDLALALARCGGLLGAGSERGGWPGRLRRRRHLGRLGRLQDANLRGIRRTRLQRPGRRRHDADPDPQQQDRPAPVSGHTDPLREPSGSPCVSASGRGR